LAESAKTAKHRPLLGAALLILLMFAAYWPVLRGQFIWDDLLLVDQNPLLTGDLGLGSVWFRTDFPLALVGFYLQWLLWGHHAAGYHIVNVLLHGLSAILVWRVLKKLGVHGAWFAAVVFAVHPVCVASVAWISELKNTLSLPFFLLSLWAFIKSPEQDHGTIFDRSDRRESASTSHRLSDQRKSEPTHVGCYSEHGESELPASTKGKPAFGLYLLSLLAFVLALLAKTSTVMLPVVLLACSWWQRGRLTGKDWLRTSPFFVLALGFGLMTVWFQAHGAIAGVAVQTENWAARLAGAGIALCFYLGKVILPVQLCMIYPRWTIDASAPLSWVGLLLWASLLGLCWRYRRAWGRHALFALGCFTIILFPALGFFDMYFLALSRVSDHFAYISLIPLLALAAAFLSAANSKLKTQNSKLPAAFGACAFALCLSALTFQRARVFADEESLWRDTLAKNPAAWLAHNNLGLVLAEQQNYEQAIEQFNDSLELNPRNAQAHCNLAHALSLQNRFAEAESHFRTALELKPNDADIHRAYGADLANNGKTREALNQMRAVLLLRPNITTRLEMGELLYETGHPREAVAQYRQVLQRKSDLPEALNNLAWLLATSSDSSLRDGAEAVRLAQRACQLSGNNEPSMLGTLAAAYAEAGRFPAAVETAEKAIRLAKASGNTGFVAAYQQLLELYRAGKPHREPPPPQTN
jgi:tetratricopeptide (TPR) repeat protein